MPVTPSAKKALRQSLRRRQRNLKRLFAIRKLTKQFRKLLAEGKFKEAEALLPQLQKALDKAAQRNVIAKNAAARKKSRLVKTLRKTTASSGK